MVSKLFVIKIYIIYSRLYNFQTIKERTEEYYFLSYQKPLIPVLKIWVNMVDNIGTIIK